MKKEKLSAKDKELIQVGKATAIKGFIDDRKNCVGCDLAGALITNSGKIFSGINMDVKTSAGASTCGERSAILHMLSQGEREINTIVAVWISRKYKKNKEWGILPPCGICRHVINQFGNPWVIISKTEKVRLRDLFPLSEMFR
jgi:cytidine deaminase